MRSWRLALIENLGRHGVAFYDFVSDEHWKHVRTTNVIESAFATVRHRTCAGTRLLRTRPRSPWFSNLRRQPTPSSV